MVRNFDQARSGGVIGYLFLATAPLKPPSTNAQYQLAEVGIITTYYGRVYFPSKRVNYAINGINIYKTRIRKNLQAKPFKS